MDKMSGYKTQNTSLMEPMLIPLASAQRAELTELAFELAKLSSGFYGRLPAAARENLTDAVRGMNCYYSNLIEGHNTHPISIENALRKDFSNEPGKRNLQLEANAHIAVQRWLDEGGAAHSETTTETIQEMHRRFCELLPPELLKVSDPQTGEVFDVIPGKFRDRLVVVGTHLPIDPGHIPVFLTRFDQVYSPLSDAEAVIAAAGAHHRLLWIHPFLDGNGRVARLMSHAMLSRRLNSGGLWSIARGMARSVETYKRLLAECDAQRMGDLDGRGNLSEAKLVNFTRFFLETCIDQVRFMEALMKPETLRARILIWAREEIAANRLPDKATRILEALLYRGELHRSETNELLGVSDRQARRIVAELEKTGAIGSVSPRAALKLRFPYGLATRWLPGLYPALPDDE